MQLIECLKVLSRLPIARCFLAEPLSLDEILSKQFLPVGITASLMISELSLFSRIRAEETIKIDIQSIKPESLLLQGNSRKVQNV